MQLIAINHTGLNVVEVAHDFQQQIRQLYCWRSETYEFIWHMAW